MDIQTLLPLISKVVGRDVSREISLFYRGRSAIGNTLNQEGKTVFIEHWPKIVDFMETPDGQKAITTFLDSWAASLVPPTITAKEKEEPVDFPTKIS